jgi:hypothetical protein
MGALGFTCSDCHTTKEHKIMGASHGSAEDKIIFTAQIATKVKFTKTKLSINILVLLLAKHVTFRNLQRKSLQRFGGIGRKQERIEKMQKISMEKKLTAK